jgi:glycosyltransferase involved in cell wall biosynthesis
MKILLISSNSSGTGGGEYYLVYLAIGLIHLGHEVHVLLSKHAYMTVWANKLNQTGAIVHHLPLAAHLDRPLRFLQAQWDIPQQNRIREFCRILQPDIIHTNHQYDEDGLDLPLAVHGIIPHIATIHLPMCATKHDRPLGRWRGRWLRRWYRRYPYPKIFVSQQAQQEFTEYYPTSELSFAIPNGVSQNILPSDRPSHYQKPFTLGFAGRLNAQKDPLFLAQTWAIVQQSIPHCRLLIAGDGEMRPELESYLIPQNGDWKILGWIKDTDELQKFYQQIDLLILTSHFESAVPLALMEAVVLGIPAIVLSIPQYQEFRSQVPMMQLVQERHPQALATAIVQEYQQENLLKSITPASLAQVRSYFSLTRMAQATLEAYDATHQSFHLTQNRPHLD